VPYDPVMRSHCAVYVDSGYLLAAAATRVTGTSLRSSVTVDHPALIGQLADQATADSGLPLLRIHWYDAARNGHPEPTHEQIGMLPRVKVRLGRIGYEGEQKGVDLRIGLDMVAHARNGAVDVMYLVSGDDDLTEAVEEAQAQGVQVIVLAVPTTDGRPHGLSRHLQQASDGMALVEAERLDSWVKKSAAAITAEIKAATPAAPVPAPAAKHPSPADLAQRVTAPRTAVPTVPAERRVGSPREVVYTSITGGTASISPRYEGIPEESLELMDVVAKRVADTYFLTATPAQREALLADRPSIPRDVDRSLLQDASESLGTYDIADALRFRLRDKFWDAVGTHTR